MKKLPIVCALLALAGGALQTHANPANVWNVNFAGNSGGTTYPVPDGQILAAPPFGAEQWNNIIAPQRDPYVPDAPLSMPNANGENPISLTWIEQGNAGHFSDQGSPEGDLFKGYYGVGTFDSTLQMSDLPEGEYDLYVYFTWGWNANPVDYSITTGMGETLAKTLTPVQATANYEEMAEDSNYVVFRGITPEEGAIHLRGVSEDGGFSALQVVQSASAVTVATDEMLATGDYTVTGSVATDRDSSGQYELEAQAGTHYLRVGGGGSGQRDAEIILTNGFVSGHVIAPGVYTASIDIGKGGGDVEARDTFTSFDFRLGTVDGVELAERAVVQEYVAPGIGEWSTIIVSYTVSSGDPVVGQTLTWMAEGAFESASNGKFGAMDNVVVNFEEAVGGWTDDFVEFEAPFSLDFGQGAGQVNADGLLRSRPDDFIFGPDSLSYTPPTGAFVSSAAWAMAGNYLERQDFSLESEMTLVQLDDLSDNRVGFSVLGGPHNPPGQLFNAVSDDGFYGLVWYPGNASGESVIQIRDGFNGEVLAEMPWEGRQPFAGGAALFEEDFEDAAFVAGEWTRGGNPAELWEIGAPAIGPAGAVSGTNVAGTDLDANYPASTSTESWLRSPVIDFTGVANATLSYSEFIDMDDESSGETFFHSATLSFRSAANPDEVVAELFYGAFLMEDWESRQYLVPQEVLDHGEVVLDFRLATLDGEGSDTYAGWFIDDILISSQETETYTLEAEGIYDISGILDLSFTLTDADAVTQTVSTSITDPHTGNLFGFGGRGRVEENPQFDFHTFSMEVGGEPMPLVPAITAPFSRSFGSAVGLDGGGDFLQSDESEWILTGDSLQLTAGAADYQNSIAASRVWNFESGDPFFLSSSMTLTSLDGGASENRVGIVLFGTEDPMVFDANDDSTFYTFAWTPNTASGGNLAVRQGLNGAVIAETDFGALDNPPAAVVGATYDFKFAGEYVGGDFVFTGVLSDGQGGAASVSGTITTPTDGNRFGFGARHRMGENAVWDIHSFAWSEALPLPMPLNYQFGTGTGRDSDEDFVKTGSLEDFWTLSTDSLRAYRPAGGTVAEMVNGSAAADVLDYTPGLDFAMRATVTASGAPEALEFFADGGHIDTGMTAGDLGIAGNNPRTIEAWAYTRAFDGNGTVWTMGNNGTRGEDFTLKVMPGEDEWVVNQWGSAGSDVWFNVPNSLNAWVHFAVVHTGQHTIVYVNGEQVARESRTINTSTVQPFRMGWWQNRGDDTGFDGYIEDVRIWDHVRTQEEIQANLDRRLAGTEDGLVAYWPLDAGEGTTANDQGPSGINGTFTAANAETGALPQWATTTPRFGLTFLGDSASFDSAYSFQWEPTSVAGGGVLRLDGPTDSSIASVELASVVGAPTYVEGAEYMFELTGTFNLSTGNLNLTGTLSDGNEGTVEVSGQVPGLAYGTWFGLTGRHPELEWSLFRMGTPEQLEIDPPPPSEGITFADWRNDEGNFTPEQAADQEISGMLAMPAGDGISNLLKYAFGLDPMTPATMSDLILETEVMDGQLRITYRERKDAEDIGYRPEVSETLETWSDTAVVEVGRETDPGDPDFDLVTVGADLGEGAERAFLHVLVIEL